jgi:hypothetical protein
LKIKHYAQPLKTIAKSTVENFLWELAVLFISGVLSYVSYQTGFGILFFPMLAVFCIALFSILITAFFQLKERICAHLEKK